MMIAQTTSHPLVVEMLITSFDTIMLMDKLDAEVRLFSDRGITSELASSLQMQAELMEIGDEDIDEEL